MITKNTSRQPDLLTRFVNWLSDSWPDREPSSTKSSGSEAKSGGKDPLSRFVNSISG
jgi:hypothetical protein